MIEDLLSLELDRMFPAPTPEMLAGMLAMVDPKTDLTAFNASLKAAGINLALEQRGGRK